MSVRSIATIVIVAALCASCSTPNRDSDKTTDRKGLISGGNINQAFISGGNIEMHLDAGDYVISAGKEDRIRVTFGGSSDNASQEITSNLTEANLTIKDTSKNFKASIEVPRISNLLIHLKSGDLNLAAITGNKDIDSAAGDVNIEVGDPNDYSSVDASVRVGDLNAGPFGKADAGLGPHVTWIGHGKYTLRASLGAGDLVLKAN